MTDELGRICMDTIAVLGRAAEDHENPVRIMGVAAEIRNEYLQHKSV
jgi:hypothetical protein